MRIESDIKLDYKDVLIRPKRSTLKSRKEVDLDRTYKFRNSNQTWTGVPIMAANMDGVGTFEMADVLRNHGMFTCITKQHTAESWRGREKWFRDSVAISVGTNPKAWDEAKEIIKEHDLNWVCIDIANGYSEHFTDFVKNARRDFPDINIIAGNVVTADMTQSLFLQAQM